MPGLRDQSMVWLVAIAAAAPACSFRAPAVPDDATIPGDDAPGDDGSRDDAAIDAPPDGATDTWWNPAWPRRRPIAIRNTELTGPVQDFPVLVRLPASVLDVAGTGGDDLRFIAGDQTTLLPYELDTATPAAGALAWVRIPALAPTGPAPALWVYYGNAAAPAGSSGAAVFGNLYVSVHHLGGDLGDASANGHTASASGGQNPAVVAGQIGEARDFDGQNDRVDVAGEAAYDFTTSFTVSAWIRRQALSSVYQAIVTKGDKAWRLHREDMLPFVGFGTTVGGANQNHNGDMSIDDASWHHVAIVFGNSMKRIYVDGQLDQAVAVAPTIDTTNVGVAIGHNSESQVGGSRLWNGDIDEVRISDKARDAHWMFAEHHTASDADFVTPGPEEIAPP